MQHYNIRSVVRDACIYSHVYEISFKKQLNIAGKKKQNKAVIHEMSNWT